MERGTMLRQLGRRLFDLVCPGFCLICGGSEEGVSICSDCARGLTGLAYLACPQCAAPAAPFHLPCSFCRDAHHPFTRAYSLGLYRGLLRDVILTAKRPGGAPLAFGIGQLFGDVLSCQLARQSYSLITAAPVHWRRQLQRGFNGAERIMCGLQSRLESLSAVMLLVHRRPIRKQAMLPMGQRNKNVRGAFRIRPGHDLTGQRILLVDDVMTTGETAGELSRILLKAGASRVDLLMIARGLPVPREEGNGFETMQTGSLAPDRRSGKNVSDGNNRSRQ